MQEAHQDFSSRLLVNSSLLPPNLALLHVSLRSPLKHVIVTFKVHKVLCPICYRMAGLSQELAQQLKFPTGTDGYDNRTSYIYIYRK